MLNPLYHRDVISISDFNKQELELIVKTATKLKQHRKNSLLSGKILASCFFEPSTRTRLSFEAAILRLGGSIIGFNDGENTSTTKGETLADSIRIISAYVDAIIIRHPRDGAARLAAEFSEVPIINGGDGSNQHPTQTLLDLFTIYECQKSLGPKLNITFIGDLKYGRTAHSLIQALCLFGSHFNFISPDALTLPDHILQELNEKNTSYERVAGLEDVVENTDIIYVTRMQKERFDETEYHHLALRYVLHAADLENAKKTMKVLHPLPRTDEISIDVDNTPHAYYFSQAQNGVYAREALLGLILNREFI